MPEGDTVWRTARTLDRALRGCIVTADFRVPHLATAGFEAQVLESLSRGKHLLMRFDNSMTLHTHLKMEGAWHLYRPDERWRRPAHEARVVLRSPDWTAVGFALGIVELLPTATEESVVGHLGPDLLGPNWDHDEAVRRLAVDPTKSFGEAILDQRNLAGIGNMYRSELCFILGVHPRTTVAHVDLLRLVTRAKALLEANKDRVEQTTTGDLRRGHRHWVYRRAGQRCLRCHTVIEREALGPVGQERGSYWCPQCQPLLTSAT